MSTEMLLETAKVVTDRATNWSAEYANEANTKRVLIEPVLRALGWDTDNLDVVTAEYKVYGGTFLDYALKTDSKPTLFVEAKQYKATLDDPKFVSQTINYANNEGVTWCVLTDGMLWRVFKANESVSSDRKLAFEVKITDLLDMDTQAEALSNFTLLTPNSVRDGDLALMGERIFVDNYVRDALVTSLVNPSTKTVNAIKEHLETTLTNAEIRAALKRVTGPFLNTITNKIDDTMSLKSANEIVTSDPKESLKASKNGVSVEITKKGVVIATALYEENKVTLLATSKVAKNIAPSAGAVVAKTHKELHAKGVLEYVDDVWWQLSEDVIFSSPSSASSVVTGTSTNGWNAWKDSDGTPLKSLRNTIIDDSTETTLSPLSTVLATSPEASTSVASIDVPVTFSRKGITMAWARYQGTEIILLAGSRVSKTVLPQVAGRVTKQHGKLLVDNALKSVDANHWQLKKDVSFSSLSAAACLVTGGSENGWNVWRTSDGKTLRNLLNTTVN